MVFSFIIASALSIGFAFLKDMIDVTIKDINDLEDIGWLVLTAMPLQKGVKFPPVISSHPKSITAEAIKLLRADLEFVTADSGIKTIAITSALPGEGASFTALNLAHACSLAGKKTLLVETDFKNPKLHGYFKIKTSESSLRNVVQNKEITPFKTSMNNLWVVSADGGVDKSGVILKEADINRYIDKWKTEFDWVIFDCPSLQVYSNSGIIIKSVGGVIPVVLAHRTSKRSVVRLQYMFDSAHLNVLGAVLNGMRKVEDSGLRYIKES
jgi:receptor protein-tyrosine kinase